MLIAFLLFLVFCNFKAFCFDCNDLFQENQCLQLEGCSWSGVNCGGVFSPSCIPPACYYIDNFTQTATPTGTPANPLATLTDGLNKLANSDGVLIIMNHRNVTLVDITSAITIKTNITIKPLIVGNYYQIIRSKMPTTALNTFTVSKQLTIIEAIFNYNLTQSNVLFVLRNGTIYLQEVTMKVLAPISVNLLTVYVEEGYSSSKFYYEGGQISIQATQLTQLSEPSQSVCFNFSSGYGSFNNVKVMELISYFAGLGSDGTLTVESCHFRGWTGSMRPYLTSPLFNIMGGNLNISRSVFEQGSHALLSGYISRITGITIQETIFRDITMEDVTRNFINILQNPTEKGINIPPTFCTIRDCLFENITSPVLIWAFRMNTQVSLINVTMSDIKTFYLPPSSTVTSFFYFWSDLLVNSFVGTCCRVDKNSTLNVISSKFTNINNSCIAAFNSILTVNSSIFNNSGIGIKKSPLSVDSLESLEVASGVTWIIIHEPLYPISINSSRFVNNMLLPMQGGAIRVIGKNEIQLSLTSNEFIENTAYYGGAVYIDNPLLRLISTKNIFTSNSAYDGGALYKKPALLTAQSFTPSVIIEDNNYTGNTAIRDGGAIYVYEESLQIRRGQFVNNSARLGGGLYAINIDSHNNYTDWHLSGVTFTNNVANDAGSSIFALSNLKLDQSIFTNNTDPLNQSVIAQKPSHFLFSFYDVIIDKEISDMEDLSAWTTNKSRTRLAYTLNTSQSLSNKLTIEHKSGTEIKQILKIEAYDEQGEILRFVDAGRHDQILIQITETQNDISNFTAYVRSGSLISTFKKGQIFLKTSLKIFGEANSKATLKFKSSNADINSISKVGFILDQDIEISFVPCEVGDIYGASSKSCNPCPFGTYSLEDPYQSPTCLECVDNAECLGGSKISPLPGYWRSGTRTTAIMQCLEETACRGGYIDEKYYPEGVCAPLHDGKLCSKCVSNSAKFGSSETCFDCLSPQYYIKLFGFFGLYLLGIILSFKYASKKEKVTKGTPQDKIVAEQYLTNEELRFNILKIVISFIQMSSIIIQYQFGWPKQVSEIIQVTNKIIPIGQDAFSIDCFVTLLLGPDGHVHFTRLAVTVVRPFIIWMIILGGHNLYTAIKEKNLKKLCQSLGTNQLVLFLIVAFVDQPHIILIALETFKCQTYGTNQSSVTFLLEDSLVECWTTIHIVWSAIAGVIFFIWGVILPILLFRKIQHIHKTDKSLKSQDYAVYKYFFGSMKSRWYYWEFISLFRKSLIIIFFSCHSVFSDLAQINLILMTIWCYMGFYGRAKPYRDERLNRLEMGSSIALMVFTYTGAYFILAKASMDNILIITMILITCSFYLLSAYYLVASYLQKPPQTAKYNPKIQIKQAPEEKETFFIDLRSQISPPKIRSIEELLQSVEMEPDEQENDQVKQQKLSKNFVTVLNSISSEPDSELIKTNQDRRTKPYNHKIQNSIGDLRDLVSHRDSEYEIMPTGQRTTTMDLLGSYRNPTTTTRENEKDYENLFGPKRLHFLQNLELIRNGNQITQEMIKLSIPAEHKGVTTPKYEVKNKRSLNNDKKMPPDN